MVRRAIRPPRGAHGDGGFPGGWHARLRDLDIFEEGVLEGEQGGMRPVPRRHHAWDDASGQCPAKIWRRGTGAENEVAL